MKFGSALLSAAAVAGMAVVSAPVAHADSYTQVGYASKAGRQVYLFRNNGNGCLHAQGRSLRWGDTVYVLASYGGNASVTANADGIVLDTPSRCAKHGTDYQGWVDIRGSDGGPMTGSYRNF
ncbi:hypothetical protein [Lentzea flaviverrucosa]|uniref:Secreted protein n=1 Tax=Lentzea flaviverrucosa TaxID=200379 RepID=A0A1H9LRY3_9PSEU|nr:hypothetical protein [Lentzea flaviverrucosa]RDI31218.1 hypothetical protein DFR72_104555 [Lentzea flaviverrucosa]SER13977.1 hypothetical protein SAMN05216195_10471 [Lentzea flaviverrucosa]